VADHEVRRVVLQFTSRFGVAESSDARMLTRFGQRVAADEVCAAASSIDFDRMRAAMKLQTNPVDRYYLLVSLVEGLYRVRKQAPQLAEELVETATCALEELPSLLPELRRNDQLNRAALQLGARAWTCGYIPMFERLEMALCEAGDPGAAKAVWLVAKAVGYVPTTYLDVVAARVDKRMKRLAKAAAR
jgi:hypothetical protein